MPEGNAQFVALWLERSAMRPTRPCDLNPTPTTEVT